MDLDKKINTLTADEVVALLDMQPLWRHDYIKLCHESKDHVFTTPYTNRGYGYRSFTGTRPAHNSAYYLIPEGAFIPWHEMFCDETWVFVLGGPLRLYWIGPHEIGKSSTTVLGPDISNGHTLFSCMEKGYWFAAEPCPGSKWSLIVHTCIPGFYPTDERKIFLEELMIIYPECPKELQRLAWPEEIRLRSLPEKEYMNL